MSLLSLLTPYQIANLETLSAFLKSDEIPPPRFNIGSYADFKGLMVDRGISPFSINYNFIDYFLEHQQAIYNHCGTTACAVGHGPLAGIPINKGEGWVHYEQRVFGISQNYEEGQLQHRAWRFLFSATWSSDRLNNTAKGTAARIDYVLKHDAIPYFNHYGSEEQPWFDGLDTSTFIQEPA